MEREEEIERGNRRRKNSNRWEREDK